MRILIVFGMIAIGVLVWKLLQRQEKGRGDGTQGDGNDRQDRFGW